MFERFRQRRRTIDYLLALAIFLLSVFGVVMIFSASSVISYQQFGNSYSYALKQVVSLLIGLILMVGMTMIDYRKWQKYATTFLVVTLVLLVAVFIPGIGLEYGNAHRWINLHFTTFQPTEVVKLAFLLYLAGWLSKKGAGIRNFSTGFIPFVVVIGLVILLVMEQPDMGTMSVIAMSATAVLFVSGVPLAYMLVYLGGAAGLFWVFVKSAPYRMERLFIFLNANQSSQGAGYHISQALLAIGSGGWWGLGFGQSRQKYMYLPEAHTDSIFAIIGEELGFLRTAAVVLVIAFIAWRGYRIAARAPDMFGKLMATGITTWFIWQSFVNIAAMLGMVPLTGVPLPFISYGGTALIMNLAAAGILLNISRQVE